MEILEEVAIVVLTDRAGRVLMQHRSHDAHPEPGRWTPPGGRLELGEDAATAAHRELLEETGLTAVLEQGWTTDCASRFQWTDAPQKFAVLTVPLQGAGDAYAIHVGMYGTDQPASSAGSQGYDYMAVILRGNSLTVLDVSQTAIEGPRPQDPGPAEMQHDVQAAAAKLAAVYASSN